MAENEKLKENFIKNMEKTEKTLKNSSWKYLEKYEEKFWRNFFDFVKNMQITWKNFEKFDILIWVRFEKVLSQFCGKSEKKIVDYENVLRTFLKN